MKNKKKQDESKKTENRSYSYNQFRQEFYGAKDKESPHMGYEARSFGESLAKEVVERLRVKIESY
jgi:hypothetical protein